MFWGLSALFAATTAYAIFRFLARLRRDRFAADTPLARIRSAAQGYVRLEGRSVAPAEGELTAPLSGLPCVWWDYKIERRQPSSRGQDQWHVVERGTSVTPFGLHDTDGECLVGPVGAEVTSTSQEIWFGDTPRPLGLPAAMAPSGNGQAALMSLERNYRYTERIIGEGAHLTVLGELRSSSGVDRIEDEVRATVTAWKHDQAMLLQRFDRNHDGQLDAAEWDAARAAARVEIEARLQTPSARVSVVSQPTHGEPFLIAPLDGPQLVRREQRRAALALAASALFLALTVWAMRKAMLP